MTHGLMAPQQFSDQLAVVSGAGSGIGRSIALALAAHGARVAALDQNQAGLASLLSDAGAQGLLIHEYVCDVGREDLVARTVEAIHAAHGSPHMLVNVAGILRSGTATTLSLADWDETFRVNTTGVMLLSRAVVRLMIPRRQGALVTVASNAGRTPRAAMCAYSASKAAAIMYTKCLGLEVAKYNIRCNVVSPGSTDTPMLAELNQGTDYQQAAIQGALGDSRLGIPLGRVAEVNDISNSVIFLLSPLTRHITLHDLTVDGGATLGA